MTCSGSLSLVCVRRPRRSGIGEPLARVSPADARTTDTIADTPTLDKEAGINCLLFSTPTKPGLNTAPQYTQASVSATPADDALPP